MKKCARKFRKYVQDSGWKYRQSRRTDIKAVVVVVEGRGEMTVEARAEMCATSQDFSGDLV